MCLLISLFFLLWPPPPPPTFLCFPLRPAGPGHLFIPPAASHPCCHYWHGGLAFPPPLCFSPLFGQNKFFGSPIDSWLIWGNLIKISRKMKYFNFTKNEIFQFYLKRNISISRKVKHCNFTEFETFQFHGI